MSDRLVAQRLDNGLWVAWRHKIPTSRSSQFVTFEDGSTVGCMQDGVGLEARFEGLGLLALSERQPTSTHRSRHQQLSGVTVSWPSEKQTSQARNGNVVVFADGSVVRVAAQGRLHAVFCGSHMIVCERLAQSATGRGRTDWGIISLVGRRQRVGV